MSQKLPINGIKWIKNVTEIDEKFIKNYDKIVIKDIFLKQTLSIPQDYMIYIVIYHFCLKE